MSQMQTPLKQVRGLGASKTGTEHFWQQRLTGLANLPLAAAVVACLVYHLGSGRAQVVASFQNPLISLTFVLAMLSVLWHMRLGMQMVIEDYIHGSAAKLAALLLNIFYVAALGVAALYAILKMSFGL